MGKGSILIINAALLKATPLLQNMVIIYFAGAAFFADIGYYYVVAIFTSTFLTAGIVPAYIRAISNPTGCGATALDFIRFIATSLVAVTIGVVIASYTGFFGPRSGVVALLLGVSLGLNGLLMPILVITGARYIILASNTLFFTVSLFIALFSGQFPISIFQYMILIAPWSLTVLFAVQFWRTNRATLGSGLKRSLWRSIKISAREVAPVLFPNVFWMAALFVFSHRVSVMVDSPEVFSWYVIGLQLYGVFVFIPNSLAPLFLYRMGGSTSAESVRFCFQSSIAILCIGLFVFVLAWSAAAQLRLLQFNVDAVNIWMYISGGGVVAAGIAPMNAHLVREHRAYLIGVGALVWALLAHVGLSWMPGAFERVFLMAYIFAYLTLVATVSFSFLGRRRRSAGP